MGLIVYFLIIFFMLLIDLSHLIYIIHLFLSHGLAHNNTVILIPKNRKQSICNSRNYMAIALSNIFREILDWVIVIKEGSVLCSSHLPLSFKKGISTTQCTYSMLDYNF